MFLSISSPQPTQVKVSAEEIAQSFLSPQSLKIAVDSILKVGYVILEDVVPHNVIDYLRQKMVQDSAYLIDRGRWNTVGNVTGHLNQALPPFQPYVFPEIVSNVFAAQVTHAFLGKDGLIDSIDAILMFLEVGCSLYIGMERKVH